MPPTTLLIKPASGSCNLKCKYCFYADEMENRQIKNYGKMSDDTVYQMLDKVLGFSDVVCNIAFQGGEPTLMGLDFYKRFIALVAKLNKKHCQITYAMQTNGYILDDNWAAFFKEHSFLIGLSLDGTKEIHNKYRINHKCEGTFDRVLESIELLKMHKVDFNVLTVVNGDVSKNASDIYDTYKKQGLFYQQYIECLDPIGQKQGAYDYSLKPHEYSKFLIELFDKWYNDISRGIYVYVQYFDNLMAILCRQEPSTCAMSGFCASYFVAEADGSVYPCDFYVLDAYKIGNFTTDSMSDITTSKPLQNFIKYSYNIASACKKCKWGNLCRNGCRRSCEPTTENSRQQNYFCESYKKFFEYAFPKLLKAKSIFLKRML